MKIKSVLIITKPSPKTDIVNFLRVLDKWFNNRKIGLYCFETIKKQQFHNISFVDKNFDLKEIDMIISLGGDGTLLGLCRKYYKYNKPIIGVNLGRLGFIANFTKNDLFDELENIINKKFTTSSLPLYSAEHISHTGKKKKYHFINDVVISKNDISRIFSLEFHVDNMHVYSLSGDGLIIASPIGSTAYSLAAGGPIISPEVKSFVVTPICAHSLTHRPLVLNDSSSITIKIPQYSSNIILTLDGQELISLDKRDSIIIKKTKRTSCKLIVNNSSSYYQKLKEKFTLGRK